MDGPDILARYLSKPNVSDKFGNVWQYHSRSDRHSIVGCWGVAFDLLATSALLRNHANAGKVVLGVNHKMMDHLTQREKKLDLVIARPSSHLSQVGESLRSLVSRYGLPLNAAQSNLLLSLPDIPVGEVGAVLIALEAKAAMTAHTKARPRLHDELNSSQLAVHGSSSQALAIALIQVNAATQFVSNDLNKFSLKSNPAVVSSHKQPTDYLGVLEKVNMLPRRSGTSGVGFDGLGAVVLDFDNRGGPVSVVTAPPAPQPRQPLHYESMIIRMANEYDSRFNAI